MKKLAFVKVLVSIILLIALILIIILMIVTCKKDIDKPTQVDEVILQPSDRSLIVEKIILNFKEKI